MTSNSKNPFDQGNDQPTISVRKVPVSSLDVGDYQRILRTPKVRKIMREFDPLLFGVITLAEVGDGTYHIIDGHHRVTAVRGLGHEDIDLLCEVISGISNTEQARVFLRRNKNRTATSAQDEFRAALIAGEDRAREIKEITEASGFTINLDTSERSSGRINAVGTLTKIDREYREGHLRDTLDLLRDTWGTNTGPQGTFIAATAMFISYYRDVWSRKRFISQLNRVEPAHIQSTAGTYRAATGMATDYSICSQFVRYYNARLREENQLPSMEEMRVINQMKRSGKNAK